MFASGANVTVPGPLVCDQVQVTAPGGVGSPSSVTLPKSDAAADRTMTWSPPPVLRRLVAGREAALGDAEVVERGGGVVGGPSHEPGREGTVGRRELQDAVHVPRRVVPTASIRRAYQVPSVTGNARVARAVVEPEARRSSSTRPLLRSAST